VKVSYYAVTFAFILALVVITLGAYTRLTNAGLGCPDWPGCYGHYVIPQQFHATTFDWRLAWTEMVHRYAAMCLGMMIVLIASIAVSQRKSAQRPKFIPLMLIAIVIFQAALGMWTVTLKLMPVVVMGHLLGGLSICALLWYLRLQLQDKNNQQQIPNNKFYLGTVIGLMVVIMQICLGGWVSANYAGLSCMGFPACNGMMIPPLHLKEAFNVASPAGLNYQGGILESPVRSTIQFVHRMGAFITFIYLAGLSLFILLSRLSQTIKQIAVFILVILTMQFILGIMNVLYLLPLSIAMAHNFVATLLLLSVVTLFHQFHFKK
jgi:heme a synthase